jgi:hypothetical protein
LGAIEQVKKLHTKLDPRIRLAPQSESLEEGEVEVIHTVGAKFMVDARLVAEGEIRRSGKA